MNNGKARAALAGAWKRSFLAIFASVLLAAALSAQGKPDKPGIERNKLTIANLIDLKNELSLIDLLEKQKDWDQLVTFCERLLPQTAGKVVQKSDMLFLSAEDALLDRLASLGAEARLAYRVRYDRVAERAFRAAVKERDAVKLANTASRFPLSSWADNALSMLASIEAEKGSFDNALAQIEMLFSRYEDTDMSMNMLYARAAWYSYYSRRTARAKEYLKKLQAGDGTEIGEAVKFRVSQLRELLASGRTPDSAVSQERYTEGIPRGGISRDGLPGRIPTVGSIAWQGRLFGTSGAMTQIKNNRLRARKRNRPLSPGSDDFRYQSAAYGGRVYTPTEVGVNVFDMRSGRLLMELRAPGGGEFFPGLDTHLAPTVTEDSVYANLVCDVTDSEDWSGILVSAAIPRYALCAFNRRSGKLRWLAHRGEKYKKYFAGKWHSIIASPVVLDGRVYAEVKVRQMLVKSFLAAFDEKTGEMEWVTPLCSNGTELTMFHYDARGPLASMLVAQQGARPTLYCCTNLGAVFALDPESGRIRWSSLYNQIPLHAADNYYANMRKIAWANCPPVLSRGVLVAAPLDSSEVYAFDAASGRVLWKFDSGLRNPTFRQLVGVVEDKVILSGTKLTALDLHSGKVKWTSTSFGALGGSGQGLANETEIVLPRPEGLYRFSTSSGKVLVMERWPMRSMNEEPGNLLQADDRLVVTGTSKITVYKRKEDR